MTPTTVVSALLRNKQVAALLMAAVAVLIAGAVAEAATTISTNLDTDGTLTVDGVSTFNGNSTFGDAATDVNLFTGTLQASTTAMFTGAITGFNGAVTFNELSGDNDFRVESDGQANMLFVDAGADRVGVATSTPGDTFSVTGDGMFGSAATTTVNIHSSAASTGGCIQLEGANGTTLYRLYVNTGGTLVTEAGSCQ